MSYPYTQSLTMPLSAKMLMTLSAASLIFVFVMQYGFGLEPCVLCIWQRIPFTVAIFLSLLALCWKPYRIQSVILLYLCSTVYLIGMGLAVFHTGVEQHWWLGTSGCAIEPLRGSSTEDIRMSLLQTIAPRCDHIAWSIFGLSIANLNIVWSLMLAFYAAAAAANHARTQKRTSF